MRIREIIPESWWNDLDAGFLDMMGYTQEEQAPEDQTNIADSVSQDMKHIKRTHKTPVLPD